MLIPAMDIFDGEVVRLSQGDFNRKTVYSKDPVQMATQFKDTGIGRLHLVDLSGAKNGKPEHMELFGDIRKIVNIPVEAGGGVRSLQDFENYWRSGLNDDEDYIMIGSLPIKDPDEFKKIVKLYAKNILLTVDVWGRNIKISGWQEETGLNVISFLKEMRNIGVARFLVTQIQRDGMLRGPDTGLYQEIDEFCPGVEVTVSGGVSSMKDVYEFPKLKTINGFILGRAFYENLITLDDIRMFFANNKISNHDKKK